MNFTFREFGKCVRAIFAFGAGYKLGEGYALGKTEEGRGKRADPEAWQLGYDLSRRRNPNNYPPGVITEEDKRWADLVARYHAATTGAVADPPVGFVKPGWRSAASGRHRR